MKRLVYITVGILIITAGYSYYHLRRPFTFSQEAQAASFDFTMETNSSIITIPQGFGGINALHVSLLSGSPQDVALSASGLPAGVTVTFQDPVLRFDREGGLAPYGSTVTVHVITSASTPIGTHTITLVGTSGGLTRNTSFKVEVVPLSGNRMYYVATSGNDANPGTQSQPFRTIQRGMNAAQAGDTIVVKAGTYYERVKATNSGTQGAPITLLGEPGAIIDGNQRITGWQPASEIAQGVYKKPMSQMPFTPGAIAYEGKYALWLWWDSIPGCCGSGFSLLTMPQDDPRWAAVGAYGYADENHGDDRNPLPPDTSTHTAYVRLRTGGNPDNEDVTFADVNAPTIKVDGKNYINIRGFTIQNGFTQVKINSGTGNVLEHNVVKGGMFSILVDNSDQTIVRNNEATLNHYVGTMLSANKGSIGLNLLFDLRHRGRDHQNMVISAFRSTDTKIYQNHVFGSLGGIAGGENAKSIEIANNYVHHFNDYALPFGIDDGMTVMVHDNIFYEVGLEGWRSDGTGNSAVVYIYRNRFYDLTHICEAGGYHEGSCSHNDLEFHTSDATQYWYHNSFAGSTAMVISGYRDTSSGGLPNTWVINNIISSEWPFGYDTGEWLNNPRWHFDYNWVGSNPNSTEPFGGYSGLWRNGAYNLIHPNTWMWNSVNPSFQAGSGARGAGIDLSKSWTMDGVTHPALPGMTPGYFSGSAPDLGACQSGGTGQCGAGGGGPTPTIPPGSSCTLYTPSSVIPTGFGVPWDVTNPSIMLVSAQCTPPMVILKAGNPYTTQILYVYKTAYTAALGATSWTPVDLFGSPLISGSWYQSNAQGVTQIPDVTQPTWYVAYTCNWNGAQWKCGCRDSTCTQSYWQLQKIQQ